LFLVFGGWEVAYLAVDPVVVEPVDVLGDGDFEVVDFPTVLCNDCGLVVLPTQVVFAV